MTPTIQQIQEHLKQILLNSLTEPPEPDQIATEAALVQDGLALDSISLLEFVIGIENEFDILLDDESLTVERFESLATLAGFIQTQLAAQSPRQDAA